MVGLFRAFLAPKNIFLYEEKFCKRRRRGRLFNEGLEEMANNRYVLYLGHVSHVTSFQFVFHVVVSRALLTVENLNYTTLWTLTKWKFNQKNNLYFMLIVDVSASTEAFVETVCLIAVRCSFSGRLLMARPFHSRFRRRRWGMILGSCRPSIVTFLYLYAFQKYCHFCAPVALFQKYLKIW